jgi:magnesium chelatase subunit D
VNLPAGPPPDLTRVLACAAIEPSLHGLLLIDLPDQMLEEVAAAYRQMLEIRYGEEPRQVTLGSYQTDDDLWTTVVQRDEDGVPRFEIGPGVLVGQPRLLVVIPNLARASLAVSRAIVELLGAPTASVARYGVSATWPPSPHWLAACAAADAGQISHHVLDRFMLRLVVTQRIQPEDIVPRLRAELVRDAQPASASGLLSGLADRWRRALADPPSAVFSAAAVRQTTEWATPQTGMRRQLGLARLARAIARLEGDRVVDPAHVDAAAQLIGLTRTTPEPASSPAAADSPVPDEAVVTPAGPEAGGPAAPVLASGPAPTAQPAVPSEPQVLTAEEVRGLDASPFPEDTAVPAREAAPLQVPAARRRGRASTTGVVIGTRPADELADVAWVATAIEAAKYQKVRQHAADGSGLVILGGDLRSYRRAPSAEFLLGLLIDHTCGRGWDWIPPLTPFLRWAYVRRAGVSLVEVGKAAAPAPLRAERTPVRSMLDSRLVAAMSPRPGAATPLADGLTRLYAEVRHALQHGGGGVTEAIVVVVTDGLGNVPLQASLNGDVTGLVRQEGVDDAVTAAAGLGGLTGCRCVCVAPPRSAYRSHLERLAAALNAPIVAGAEAAGLAERQASGGPA